MEIYWRLIKMHSLEPDQILQLYLYYSWLHLNSYLCWPLLAASLSDGQIPRKRNIWRERFVQNFCSYLTKRETSLIKAWGNFFGWFDFSKCSATTKYVTRQGTLSTTRDNERILVSWSAVFLNINFGLDLGKILIWLRFWFGRDGEDRTHCVWI